MPLDYRGGQSVQRGTQGGRKPLPFNPADRKTDMVLVAYDHSWTFDVESQSWLPLVREVQMRPGGNGVYTRGDKDEYTVTADYTRGLSAKGGVVIEQEDRRLGEDFRDWLRVQAMPGGKVQHFHCRWDEYGQIGTRVITRHDRADYAAFCQHLVDMNIVQPMPHEVLEWKIQTLENRRESLPERKLEGLDASIKAMREAWEEQFGAKPEPKRTRKQKTSEPTEPVEN